MDIEQQIFKASYDSQIAKGVSPYRIAFNIYLEAKEREAELLAQISKLEARGRID